MKPEETLISSYYILTVSGTFQEWDRKDNTKLTEPRPFEGWVHSTGWGYGVSDRGLLPPHRFEKASDDLIDPKNFGPWWYTVTDQQWVRVDVVTKITRTPLPKGKRL